MVLGLRILSCSCLRYACALLDGYVCCVGFVVLGLLCWVCCVGFVVLGLLQLFEERFGFPRSNGTWETLGRHLGGGG